MSSMPTRKLARGVLLGMAGVVIACGLYLLGRRIYIWVLIWLFRDLFHQMRR